MHYDAIETTKGPVGAPSSAARPGAPEFERFVRYADGLDDTKDDTRSLRAWLDLAETWRITQALRDCRGNRSAAARLLGIGRRTLYAKMDKLGIVPSWNV